MYVVAATLSGLILLLLAIIGVHNPSLLTIQFLGWQTGVLPLWGIMVAAFVIGMLLVALVTLPGRIGRFRTTRRLQHQRSTAAGVVNTHAVAQRVDGDHRTRAV